MNPPRHTVGPQRLCHALAALAAVLALSACVSGRHDRADPPDDKDAFVWPPGDTPQPLDRPLTFEEAVSRAFEVSPSLHVLMAQESAARLAVRATRDLQNPELRGSWSEGEGSFTDTFTPLLPTALSVPPEITGTTVTQWRVSARIFPPNPFTAGPVRQEARSAAAAAALRIQQERALIVDQLRTAWLTLACLHNDYQLAAAQFSTAREAAETVATQLEAGSATRVDAAEAEQLTLRALEDLHRAETARAAAHAELSALLFYDAEHLTFTEMDWLSGELEPPSANETSAILAHVRENTLDARIAEHEAAAVRNAYRAARRAWIPWPRHIEASYGESEGRRFSPTLEDVTQRKASDEEWRLSVAVEVPLFNLFNHGTQVLKAQWQALELQGAMLRENKVAEARHALSAVRRSARQLETFNLLAESAADHLRNLVASGGDTTIFRPRDRARHALQLIDLQRKRLRLEYEVRRHLLQLEILCGGPLDGLAREPTEVVLPIAVTIDKRSGHPSGKKGRTRPGR